MFWTCHTHLWDAWEERLDVNVGVVHLQVMIPQPTGHSDCCHDSCLRLSHAHTIIYNVAISGCDSVLGKSTSEGLVHDDHVLSDNNENVKQLSFHNSNLQMDKCFTVVFSSIQTNCMTCEVYVYVMHVLWLHHDSVETVWTLIFNNLFKRLCKK